MQTVPHTPETRVFIARQGEVMKYVPALMPWLEKMALWTRGRRTTDDILYRVLHGECNLWVTLAQDGHFNGALVTKVERYPRMQMLHVLHCAGEKGHMEEIADAVYDALDKFAVFNHCSGIEFIGRPGWEKHVKDRGYEVRSVTFQKFFEEGRHAHP